MFFSKYKVESNNSNRLFFDKVLGPKYFKTLEIPLKRKEVVLIDGFTIGSNHKNSDAHIILASCGLSSFANEAEMLAYLKELLNEMNRVHTNFNVSCSAYKLNKNYLLIFQISSA